MDLRGVDYSDETPDVAYSYDRQGRQKAVTDAGGQLIYGYQGQQLESETRLGRSRSSGEALYHDAKQLTYNRDDLNRSIGFQVGTESDPDQDYAVRYGLRYGGSPLFCECARLRVPIRLRYRFQFGSGEQKLWHPLSSKRSLHMRSLGIPLSV